MAAIVLVSWGVALFEYCFQVPANRLDGAPLGGPFSIWELKVIRKSCRSSSSPSSPCSS